MGKSGSCLPHLTQIGVERGEMISSSSFSPPLSHLTARHKQNYCHSSFMQRIGKARYTKFFQLNCWFIAQRRHFRENALYYLPLCRLHACLGKNKSEVDVCGTTRKKCRMQEQNNGSVSCSEKNIVHALFWDCHTTWCHITYLQILHSLSCISANGKYSFILDENKLVIHRNVVLNCAKINEHSHKV